MAGRQFPLTPGDFITSKITEYLDSMQRDITRDDLWTKEQAQAWASRYWQIRWDKSLSEDQQREALAAARKGVPAGARRSCQ